MPEKFGSLFTVITKFPLLQILWFLHSKVFFWEQILKFYSFWLLLNKYYSAYIEIHTWYSCFLTVCIWFHGFSRSLWPTEAQELKTSPYLSYISIKSWHFFQVVKKKTWLGLSVNPEESAVIWGPKWSNADSLTFNSFTVCGRTVSPLFL